jgi:hypothetical protein
MLDTEIPLKVRDVINISPAFRKQISDIIKWEKIPAIVSNSIQTDSELHDQIKLSSKRCSTLGIEISINNKSIFAHVDGGSMINLMSENCVSN